MPEIFPMWLKISDQIRTVNSISINETSQGQSWISFDCFRSSHLIRQICCGRGPKSTWNRQIEMNLINSNVACRLSSATNTTGTGTGTPPPLLLLSYNRSISASFHFKLVPVRTLPSAGTEVSAPNSGRKKTKRHSRVTPVGVNHSPV